MDSTQLTPLLNKKIALLPGGRDRRGGAVIVFPSHGEFIEFSYADVVSVLSYYAQIPEENVRARGYTIIVDMRHAWIRYLKTILKAIQHVLYGKVRQTIIVKPEHFLEKQRIIIDLKLEVYEFKICLVSLHKLTRHVDISQLPTIFNGSLPYDHGNWVDLRMRYEEFSREAAVISKRTEIVDASTSKSSSSDSLEFPAVTSGPGRTVEELITKGQNLLADLRREAVTIELGGTGVIVNPDYQAWSERVQVMLHQVQGDEDSAKAMSFEKEKTQREQTEKVVYDQFVMGVRNVSDWLTGPGEKWLLSLLEIGESTDEAEQLKRDHDQLKNKAMQIESQTAELRLISDELLALNHPQSTEISRKRDYLESMTKRFVYRVGRQREVITVSVGFHSLVDQFTKKLDDMLENLCSEVSANDTTTTQMAIDALDALVSAIEKSYDGVVGEGKRFLHQLTLREDNPSCFESTDDYLPGIIHMRHTLSYLQDRHQRSQELADVRRLKLQQMLQLFTCESDGVQAIKWLRDLYDALLSQRSQPVTGADETAATRRDHQKLEQTAKSTYEYGRQLVHISSVLRRSLRFEMAPNFQLSQQLEEAWSQFCRGLSEHVSRTNLAQAFFHTVKQIGDRLETLCGRVSDELERSRTDRDSYENGTVTRFRYANAVLHRYENQRRDLIGDVKELRHIGQALIARMEHPVDSRELAHVDHSAIDDIRRRMDQVGKQLCLLDSYWTSANPTSSSMDDPVVLTSSTASRRRTSSNDSNNR